MRFRKFLTINNIILILFSILVAYNTFFLGIHVLSKIFYKFPILEPGSQFSKFKGYLIGSDAVGYFTDKDMSEEKNDGSLLQAQYYLAPIIVRYNKPVYPYNIIDSEDLKYIIPTVQSLSSYRVTNNDYGQALLKAKDQ